MQSGSLSIRDNKQNSDQKDITLKEQKKSFSYLDIFEPAEIQKICKQFNLTQQQIDILISNHPKTYYFYKSEYILAVSSNLLYIIYQISTSNDGIQGVVSLFAPTLNVSNAVGYGIGGPLAVLATGLYMSTFSPTKEAVRATLHSIHRQPAKDLIRQACPELKAHPSASVKKSILTSIHKSIILINNATGTTTLVVQIADALKSFPTPLNYLSISSIFYFGLVYYSKYANQNYYEGLDFWHDKTKPYLLGEISRGNIFIPLQIFLQGVISSVGLRTFPYQYYLAVASANSLGWWFPTPLIAITATIYGLAAYYPATYNYYLDDAISIDKYLLSKLEPSLNLFLENTKKHFNLEYKISDESLDKKQVLDKIQVKKQLLNQMYSEQKHNFFILRHEPSLIITLLYRMLIGGYFGFAGLAPFLNSFVDEQIFIPIISTLLGIGFFGGSLYAAEKNRIVNKMLFAKLKKMDSAFFNQNIELVNNASVNGEPANKELAHDVREYKDEKDNLQISAPRQNQNCREKLSYLIADGLNIAGGLSTVMSTIGSATRLVGYQSPIVITMITVIAVENMINGILFNADKLRNTIKSYFATQSSKYSILNNNCFSFFNCRKRAIVPENKTDGHSAELQIKVLAANVITRNVHGITSAT